MYGQNFYFKMGSDNPKKILMSAVSMSRKTIAACLSKADEKKNACNKGVKTK